MFVVVLVKKCGIMSGRINISFICLSRNSFISLLRKLNRKLISIVLGVQGYIIGQFSVGCVFGISFFEKLVKVGIIFVRIRWMFCRMMNMLVVKVIVMIMVYIRQFCLLLNVVLIYLCFVLIVMIRQIIIMVSEIEIELLCKKLRFFGRFIFFVEWEFLLYRLLIQLESIYFRVLK